MEIERNCFEERKRYKEDVRGECRCACSRVDCVRYRRGTASPPLRELLKSLALRSAVTLVMGDYQSGFK